MLKNTAPIRFMESSPQYCLPLTLSDSKKNSYIYVFESNNKTKFHYSFFSVCFFLVVFSLLFCSEVCFCTANTVYCFFPANSILFVYIFVVQKKIETIMHTLLDSTTCIYIYTYNEFLINHEAHTHHE